MSQLIEHLPYTINSARVTDIPTVQLVEVLVTIDGSLGHKTRNK